MLDPSLVRVCIEELSVDAYLGVHDSEQQKPRKVIVDVEFDYDQPATDSLAAAIDYRAVRNTVLAATDNRRFSLVETMARAILDALKEETRMTRVSVQVRKPGALRQAKAVAARVEWNRIQRPIADK